MKRSPDLDLLYELYLEFTASNGLLLAALDHLDKLGHPFADAANLNTTTHWIERHIRASKTYVKVSERLEAAGYALEEPDWLEGPQENGQN